MNMNEIELLKNGLFTPNEDWKNFEDWLMQTHKKYIEDLSWSEYTSLSKQYLISDYENKAKRLRRVS